MAVLALTFFILLHFTLLGRAVLIALIYKGSSLRAWLLSPVMGVAVQVLIVSVLNQAGWPLEKFARIEVILSTLFALVILIWRRPSCRLRILGPFIGVVTFSILYTGWPALVAGSGWVSYANDDMANYCLAAVRHLHNGFFRTPTLAELGGTDYSQYFWFMHVGGLMRFGSELLLAWVAGWTGLNPLKIFMPTVMALAGTLLSATAALTLAGRHPYRIALGSALILALSPLFLIATYYQLIAQVAGLSLVLACCAIICDRRIGSRQALFFSRAVIAGILGAALCVTYPEITPFAVLGYGLLVVVAAVKTRKLDQTVFFLPAAVVLVIVVLLRYNILVFANTLLVQSASGTQLNSAQVVLFPYFLIPSGLADLFGFLPIATLTFEPLNSFLIVCGALLLGFISIRAIRAAWHGTIYGCISVVMLLIGALLFVGRGDFGLFKLAMFCQPVLAILLAGVFFIQPGKVRLLFFFVYGLAQISASLVYSTASLGNGRGFISLPGISQARLNIADTPVPESIKSDIPHIVAAKLAALNLPGQETSWVSRDFFSDFDVYNRHVIIPRQILAKFYPHAEEIFSVPQLWAVRKGMFISPNKLFGSDFSSPKQLFRRPGPFLKLSMPARLGIFNHFYPNSDHSDSFYNLDSKSAQYPLLSFVNSSRGEHYYLPSSLSTVSLNQAEPDYYAPSQTMAGLGQFLLFSVETPEPRRGLYLRIALTRTLMGQQRTGLPPEAKVWGQTKTTVPFVGAGAANLFVGPLEPLVAEGNCYLAVDLGEAGQPFATRRSGAMLFYNRNVLLDPRFIVAFGRDISCLSQEEYEKMERPRQIANFPADIAEARTLEFSGWFEDGWISQHAQVVFGPASVGDRLKIKGVVPGIGNFLSKRQRMEVQVNGASIYTGDIAPGPFDLQIPLAGEHHRPTTRIELVFSERQTLPSPDDRPIAAKIDFIGLVHD